MPSTEGLASSLFYIQGARTLSLDEVNISSAPHCLLVARQGRRVLALWIQGDELETRKGNKAMQREMLCREGASLWDEWFTNVCALGEVIAHVEWDRNSDQRRSSVVDAIRDGRDQLIKHQQACHDCLASGNLLALSSSLSAEHHQTAMTSTGSAAI